MSRYITIQKTDKDFNKYIWGTFSDLEFATPVQSVKQNIQNQEVTFEIKNIHEVNRPFIGKVILQMTKWNYYYLLLVPLFFVFAKNLMFGRLFDLNSFLMSAISSILLCAGLNIRNEVVDHISGYDQVVFLGKPKPLNKAWITAWQANLIAWGLMTIAIVIATPVFLAQKEALRVALVTFVLLILGNFLNKNNYKFNSFSEFILFILFGPALCTGYQTSLGAGIDTEIIVFGTLWGMTAMFLVYIVQFSNLFETSQAGIKNTLTRLGFDKAKIFLKRWWICCLLLWFVFHYFYSSLYWSIMTSLILIFWSISTIIKISAIHSPIGSDLKMVREYGFKIVAIMITLLVIEQIGHVVRFLDWFS